MKPTIIAKDNSDGRGPVQPYNYVVKHAEGKHDQATHAPGVARQKGDVAAGRQVAAQANREFEEGGGVQSITTPEGVARAERAHGAMAVATAPNRGDADKRMFQIASNPAYEAQGGNRLRGAQDAYQARFPDADL